LFVVPPYLAWLLLKCIPLNIDGGRSTVRLHGLMDLAIYSPVLDTQVKNQLFESYDFTYKRENAISLFHVIAFSL
jgi:hypothetical protein